ncbi:MAG: hypothetical protein K0B01_10455 [Syntrophobacterales bacterium]|nr:hypothetical protein [Syntrophobacterales bacterium]
MRKISGETTIVAEARDGILLRKDSGADDKLFRGIPLLHGELEGKATLPLYNGAGLAHGLLAVQGIIDEFLP